MVVETGVEPVNGKSRIDLQSTSFDHLDTPPSSKRTVKVWGRFGLCQAVFSKTRGWLNHAGFPETIVAPATRIGGRMAHNHMVKQIDVQGPRRLTELSGNLHVGGTR
jgi:hypothetical protein